MWNFLKSIGRIVGINIDEELDEKEENQLIEALYSNEDYNTFVLKEFHNCEFEEKTGSITHVSGDTIVIDNEYYFNAENSSNSSFSLNDFVRFTVFYNNVNIIIKDVQKLETFSSESLGNPLGQNAIENALDNKKCTLSGQVVKRCNRIFEIKLDDLKDTLKINLDGVKSEFIPWRGDFVDLDAISANPDNRIDISQIKVLKIRPRKTALKIGVVTSWDSVVTKHGSISNFAFFTSDSCEAGFEPFVCQKVFASLIRSDCENGFKWRAIRVIPQSSIISDFSSVKHQKFIEDEFRNKCGIAISIPSKVELNLNDSVSLTIDVTNKSSTEKAMCVFCDSSTSQDQIVIMHPTTSKIPVKAGETIEFLFRIHAKFIGSSYGEFVWDFGDFKIRRKISFHVKCDSIPRLNNDNVSLKTCVSKHISAKNILEKSSFEIMPGRRHKLNSVFVPVKIGQYLVPRNLAEAALPEEKLKFDELRLTVENVSPYLKQGLTAQNYRDYMHCLLYLEEIEFLKNIAKLEIEGASFRRHLDYLILDVPEYSLYTKLFLPGDFVLISLPWDRTKKMQGIIHRVIKKELWLKFALSFHNAYQEGTTYYVSFVASRTCLRRMHQAVDIAFKHLGKKWLFPNCVYTMPLQVTVDEIDEDLFECRRTMQETTVNCNSKTEEPLANPFLQQQRFYNNRKRQDKMWNRSGAGCGRHYNENEYITPIKTKKIQKIKWYNSALNIKQKEAVMRVLLGEARPLPYVIFGPPGTGKTVTVVEAILQLHNLIPTSKILVATPTNSAADLLAGRLIDSGNLQEGDFLRLVGLNYVEQGKLSAALVPYSATASLKDGANNEGDLSDDIQAFNRQQISEHRIIVGTTGCLGVLYNMGFPRGFFTHIFIDEAGQTTEPEIMVPMAFLSLQNGQVILSGDPLQLGPVVTSHLASEYGLSESFLVRLLNRFPYIKDPEGFSSNNGYDPRLVTKLIDNYRSLDGILQLFSSLYYDGDLVAKISNETSEEAILLQSLNSRKIVFPVLFHGVQGSCLQETDCKSWYNPEEVFQVFAYLNKLYAEGLQPDQIGIITPYQLQARKISMMLEFYNLEAPKVGSVEEFQGQEKMVIILSLVKCTDDLDDFRNSQFVTDQRRMNVALSRARSLLIIIGDPEFLCRNPNWCKVLRYCKSNNSYIGCELPPIIYND